MRLGGEGGDSGVKRPRRRGRRLGGEGEDSGGGDSGGRLGGEGGDPGEEGGDPGGEGGDSGEREETWGRGRRDYVTYFREAMAE